MTKEIDQLFDFVQESYLWQFHSRSWDRQENIDGIIAAGTALLIGATPKRETPQERLFYADAKVMVDDFEARFPWISDVEPARIPELMKGLAEKLVEFTITRSLNHELNHTLY
jgi:vanadium nitrogenase delta subunit